MIAKNIGLSDFEINYKADVPGETQLLNNDRKNKTETFPKFPSVLRVIDRSDRNLPITAR